MPASRSSTGVSVMGFPFQEVRARGRRGLVVLVFRSRADPVVAPADETARGDGRQRPSERVDEQRDGSRVRRDRSLEHLDRVGEIAVAGQVRRLEHDDRVDGDVGAGVEEREHRVRRVGLEAVVADGP